MKLKFLFFGTPAFSAEILRFLLKEKVPILAVVTQPDRPQNRSSKPMPSPVKEVAIEAALPVLQPEKASDPAFIEELKKLQADLYIVAAFGQILSQALLDVPSLGCINVHTSLLPKYRGAAPIQRCLMQGDTMTGITIMKVVRKLDAGDILAVAEVPILPEMSFGELEKELCNLSKPLLLTVLHAYEKGTPLARPQDPELVTYAAKIDPAECKIDFSKSAREIQNQIRALSPSPAAWCWVEMGGEKKRLKILRATENAVRISPFFIPCGKGFLHLLEVQPEGRKSMKIDEWARGLRISWIEISFH